MKKENSGKQFKTTRQVYNLFQNMRNNPFWVPKQQKKKRQAANNSKNKPILHIHLLHSQKRINKPGLQPVSRPVEQTSYANVWVAEANSRISRKK